MKYNSALLIYPQAEELGTVRTQLWQPPLGLMSIATYVRQKEPCFDIRVLNEEIKSDRSKIAAADAEVVGISAGLLNYRRAIVLAEHFKKNGSVIVFGGPYPSVLPKEMLNNRRCIDYIVRGEGEEPFYQLLSGVPVDEIKGLAYRTSNGLQIPPSHSSKIEEFPLIDRSVVNMWDYFSNWRETFPKSSFKNPTTIYSQAGCTWRNAKRSCIFCARTDLLWRGRNPSNVWEEIQELVDNYEVDYVRDLADSFSQHVGWLKAFIEQKPKDLSVPFRIWARSDQINEGTIEYLAKLNVHDVFLGTESGDTSCLERMQKGITPNDNIKAIKLLGEYGIKTFISFVLGLPGETEKSLENTLRHIETLVKIGNIETMVSQVLKPLPGSRAFNMLVQKTGDKYLGRDEFDVEELRQDWVAQFCNIDYNQLQEVNRKIQEFPVPMKYHK